MLSPASIHLCEPPICLSRRVRGALHNGTGTEHKRHKSGHKKHKNAGLGLSFVLFVSFRVLLVFRSLSVVQSRFEGLGARKVSKDDYWAQTGTSSQSMLE